MLPDLLSAPESLRHGREPTAIGEQLTEPRVADGHVDAVAEVVGTCAEGDSTRIGVSVPKVLAPMIACKGSITIDGVSLTVNEVRDDDDATHFAVNIIPHTADRTTLGDISAGKQLNVEVDVLARYLDRMMAARAH